MQRGNSVPEPGPPQPAGEAGAGGTGVWYAGARPPGGQPDDLPVLVFIPGLGDAPSTFWAGDEFYGPNDLYARAWADGFRTAFAGFAGPGGKPMNMWKCGRLLARELEQICRRFGVSSVVAVGHSKGGVDAEAAAAYYGAAPRIAKLVTLSSPHWGSQLADLAYSSFAWRLGERIGVHSEGCYCLQTEYMTEFRRMTQTRPAPRAFETFAGDGEGPPLSKLRAGSLYLSRFGPNDCAVTVQSAQNPRARHVATLHYDHAQMRLGRCLWPWIRGAAAGFPVESVTAAEAAAALPMGTAVPAASSGRPSPAETCGQILRGGPLANGADEPFDVDSGVTSMELFVTVAGGGEPVLIGPGKTRITAGSQPVGSQPVGSQPVGPGAGKNAAHRSAAPGNTVPGNTAPENTVPENTAAGNTAPGSAFVRSPAPGDAVRYDLRLEKPETGRWRLRLPPGGAYLAVLRLCASAGDRPLNRVKTRRRVLRVRSDALEPVLDDAGAGPLPPLPVGLYSVETALTGECPDGSTCQRSFQHSLLVRPPDGEAALPGGGPKI